MREVDLTDQSQGTDDRVRARGIQTAKVFNVDIDLDVVSQARCIAPQPVRGVVEAHGAPVAMQDQRAPTVAIVQFERRSDAHDRMPCPLSDRASAKASLSDTKQLES
jgi:hypothetical protein